MKILPMPKYIVAKRFEKPKTGALILLEEKFDGEYVVESVGSKVENISPGDKILVDKYSHKDHEIDGQKYYIIPQDSILGVFV